MHLLAPGVGMGLEGHSLGAKAGFAGMRMPECQHVALPLPAPRRAWKPRSWLRPERGLWLAAVLLDLTVLACSVFNVILNDCPHIQKRKCHRKV